MSTFKVGDVFSLDGSEFLATREYFALLDENRNFKKGQAVECLPCLKKVKHYTQAISFKDAYASYIITNGVRVDNLSETTMQAMIDRLVVPIQ